jgi:hypothetical protein
MSGAELCGLVYSRLGCVRDDGSYFTFFLFFFFVFSPGFSTCGFNVFCVCAEIGPLFECATNEQALDCPSELFSLHRRRVPDSRYGFTIPNAKLGAGAVSRPVRPMDGRGSLH